MEPSRTVLKARFVAAVAVACLAACSGRSPSGNFVPQPFTLRPLDASANSGVRFIVTLPLRDRKSLTRFLDGVSDPASPTYQRFLTREQFAAQYAPRDADLRSVELELRRAGFTTQRDLLGISAAGDAAHVERYFAVPLVQATWPVERGTFTQLAARGSLHLSPLLRSVGVSVVGLENLPPMQKFSRITEAPGAMVPHNGNGPYGPYLTPDLKQAYRWPSFRDVNGAGVTMAVIIDLPVMTADVNAYAQKAIGQNFHLSQIAVDGGGKWNASGSGEATLDVEQSAGMAPGANVIVYHTGALNFSNLYDGYDAAFRNTKVDVVNSSFGACEDDFATSSGQNAFAAADQLFAAGAAVGVTLVASSDDQAAFGCPQNAFNRKGVAWPAVDPYVLGVGGTNLTTSFASSSLQSTYAGESAFDEPLGGGSFWGSGGGYSTLVARPSWQKGFDGHAGRGVPDMSLHMGGEGFSGNGCQALRCNPNDSSDWIRIGGKWLLAIGTSAASPDVVGLIALRIEKHHKLQGDIHRWLYTNGKGRIWRKGIKGGNGYKATTGAWDPVLGLGTPFGNTFVGTSSVAGTPGSSTNP